MDALRDPELTLAIALLAGVAGQTLAYHLRIPGIVILLALGVLLGPDVLGLVFPDTLGAALGSLVGFAVAIILFEGGLNLHLPELRRAGAPLRRLITIGAIVTFFGAAIAAKLTLKWGWTPVILFASLVTVTGPTVVTPLVKRLEVQKNVATLLIAEGVLIDPVGAIGALVVLEQVLHPATGGVFAAIGALALRLSVGIGIGIAGGAALVGLLRPRRLIPEQLTNVVALAWVLALWRAAELVRPESGIATVIAAGMTVRALVPRPRRELLDFKEQLTSLFIGMLFVLLAADMRLSYVVAVGWRGVATVAALMLVVRPLSVLVSTAGTSLGWRERLFVAWTAPRGIVAASVASLFAIELNEAGIPGGDALRALVFLVIALTVVVGGLTGGFVARALGLKRPTERGWVILGANAVGRRLARALVGDGEEVVVVDVSPDACALAEADDLRVIHGNGLEDEVLAQADLDTRRGVVGLTANQEVNWLFAEKARVEGGLRELVAATGGSSALTPEMLHHADVRRLGGGPVDVDLWSHRLTTGAAVEVHAIVDPEPADRTVALGDIGLVGDVLPLVLRRDGRARPVGVDALLRRGDTLLLLVAPADVAVVVPALRGLGLQIDGTGAVATVG